MAIAPAVGQAEWQPVEKISTYAITGSSGIDLYRSIGKHGPVAGGNVRAIAHTDFKLTWTRKYQPQPDRSCVLTLAKPKLIITYRLPKPSNALPSPLAASWEAFVAGVHAHERIHGTFIKEMVQEIEKVSVGLSAPDDTKCQKIRADLQARLATISQRQRQRGRDFDQVELSEGGNIHQLVLKLVNGQ
nr:DUF922 domain-containing protein [Rhizobium setariae]